LPFARPGSSAFEGGRRRCFGGPGLLRKGTLFAGPVSSLQTPDGRRENIPGARCHRHQGRSRGRLPHRPEARFAFLQEGPLPRGCQARQRPLRPFRPHDARGGHERHRPEGVFLLEGRLPAPCGRAPGPGNAPLRRQRPGLTQGSRRTIPTPGHQPRRGRGPFDLHPVPSRLRYPSGGHCKHSE